jgi:hypothetical protein
MLFAFILFSAPVEAVTSSSSFSSLSSPYLAFQRSRPFQRKRVNNAGFRSRPMISVPNRIFHRQRMLPWRSQVLPVLASTIDIRGGAAAFSVRAVLSNVGSSKTKCWILLVVSILFETLATTLSKRARDIGSPLLFVAACVLYLIWCVTMCANSELPAFHRWDLALMSSCFVSHPPLNPCERQYDGF